MRWRCPGGEHMATAKRKLQTIRTVATRFRAAIEVTRFGDHDFNLTHFPRRLSKNSSFFAVSPC